MKKRLSRKSWSRSRSRRKTRRDRAPWAVTKGRAEPRSLPRFRREVAALLVTGHRADRVEAAKLVHKWDRYLKARRKAGAPPCSVSDHIAKFERERLVRPTARDAVPYRTKGYKGRLTGKKARAVLVQKGRVVGRFPSRKAALRAGRKLVARTGVLASVVSATPKGKKSRERWHSVRTRRDAPGDLYESRAGNRWEVITAENGKVRVRRVGHKQTGDLVWGKGVLNAMKKLGRADKALAEAASGGPETKRIPEEEGPVTVRSPGVASDPRGRGRALRATKRSPVFILAPSRSHRGYWTVRNRNGKGFRMGYRTKREAKKAVRLTFPQARFLVEKCKNVQDRTKG